MEMECINQIISPQQGLWTQECEQDFCKGAKVLNSLHPASTPPTTTIFNEGWLEISDTLGCGGLEVFSDVFLPELHEENNFVSNFFERQNEAELLYSSYSGYAGDILSSPEPERKVNETEKPKFTIKLKKVKCPKKNVKKSTDHCFTSPSHQNDFLLEPNLSSCENSFSQFPNTPDFDLFNDISIDSPSVTLKEVLNMEDPDAILRNCLFDAACFSPVVSSTFSDNSDMSSSEDDTHSLLSRSPGLSSSNEQNSPEPYYSLSADFQDSPQSVSSKRRSSSNQESKKLRHKLSPESRYVRKKEQNKQAALRYRVKKKQEEEQLMNVVKEEERESEDLHKTYNNLKQEMSFLKKLMRETLLAKKMVPLNAFD